MLPYLCTTAYSGGFRGRNTWLTFEPDLAQLQALRERVASEMAAMGLAMPEDEWSLLLALRHYVHRQLPSDGWHAAERLDAFTLLDQARAGIAYRCVEHSRLLCQVYQAFGLPARALGLRLITPNLGVGASHHVTEVWLTAENRWVIMDSQSDSHWEHAGRALGADELQQLVLTGRAAELHWAFASADDGDDAEPVLRHWAGYFARITCGADVAFLSRPLQADRAGKPLISFLAPQALPQFQFQGIPDPTRLEPDPGAFWFPCNQVTIHVLRVQFLPDAKARLEVELEHCAPWFDRFDLEATGSVELDGNKVVWTFDEGNPLLSVRTVNAMGRKGQPAHLGFMFYAEESMARAEELLRQYTQTK
ncbi:MAG: transglutaminase-like domain-containing protein [Mycobacterium leprae]